MSDFPSARVVADSTYPDGVRLTTLEVVMHRYVLAEFNTHRVFSRNSASSRAIPVTRQMDRIVNWPALPVTWPSEQKGMQGGESLSRQQTDLALGVWLEAQEAAVSAATGLTRMGLHKSVTNRLLEPFMRHTVVVTSTAWENFFALRLDTDAQPEIRMAAEAMKAAYDASTPQDVAETMGWHLPYVDVEDVTRVGAELGARSADPSHAIEALARISAARCARTSYLTQDGKRDIMADLDLYDRLVTDRVGKAIHWSPLEHVATPWSWNRQEGCIHFGQDEALVGVEDTFTCMPLDHLPRTGNLLGWRSLRTTVEAQLGERTYR